MCVGLVCELWGIMCFICKNNSKLEVKLMKIIWNCVYNLYSVGGEKVVGLLKDL